MLDIVEYGKRMRGREEDVCIGGGRLGWGVSHGGHPYKVSQKTPGNHQSNDEGNQR